MTLPGTMLALWLCLLGPGLGALPLVLAADAAAWRGPLVRALRSMLVLALVAPAGLLLLAWGGALFAHRPGWQALPWVGVRGVVVLAGLAVLGLLARRDRGRGFALGGMALYAVLAGLLVVDWVLGEAGALHGASLLPLVMAGWMCLAAGIACVREAGWRDGTVARAGGVLLAVLLGLWLFVAFTQFLVAWSADLPAEAGWYLARLRGPGSLLVAAGAGASGAALALLPTRLGQRRAVRSACGVAVAGVQVLALLWLAAPGGGAHGG